MRGFPVGDPEDEGTYIGAITRRPQLAVLKRQVADAKKKGAKLLLGGDVLKRKGNWFAPTVLADVDHSMEVMREESFGPIVGIMKVRNDEEAIALMNDSPYGLTASIWTRDTERAVAIGDRIETGTVFMNRCDYLDPALVWTGVKDTGKGAALSAIGYDNLTRPKSYHLREAI